MTDTKPTRTIVNKYSVGIFIGILLLVGGLYTVEIFDNKIEVTLPSDECGTALLRVTKDDFTLKCGSRIAFQADTVIDYWRTYGQNAAGEEEWWERNTRFVGRNKKDIKLDLIEYENSFDIVRTTRYRKGRQNIEDGTLKETYTFSKDKIKITYDYKVKNKAEHKISMRIKKQYKAALSAFDPNGYTGFSSGDTLFYKGFGDLLIDPTVTLVSPADNSVAYNESDTAPFICQIVDDSDSDFANISLWWNAEGTWEQAATEPLSGIASANITFSLVIPHQDDAGTFVWNCYGCNSSGTCDWDANDTMNPVYAPNAINLTGPGDAELEDLNLLEGTSEVDTMYEIYGDLINTSANNGTLYINWTHPTHPDGDNMTFNLSYFGTTTTTRKYDNFRYSTANGSILADWNYSALTADDYYITIKACSEDNSELCSEDTYTIPIEIFDYVPSISTGESEIRFSPLKTYTTRPALGQTDSKGIVQIDWTGYGAPTGTINLTLIASDSASCTTFYEHTSDNVSAVDTLTNGSRVLIEADARSDPEYIWLWLTKASCGTTTIDTTYTFGVLE